MLLFVLNANVSSLNVSLSCIPYSVSLYTHSLVITTILRLTNERPVYGKAFLVDRDQG